MATLTIGACCVGGLAAGASAADAAQGSKLVSAIKQQDRLIIGAIKSSGGAHFTIDTPGQAKKALPGLKKIEVKLRHAQSVVESTPTTDATEQKARTDWAAGAGGVADAFGHLVVAGQDVESGHTASAKTEAKAALKDELTAARKVSAANKLLGIKPPH